MKNKKIILIILSTLLICGFFVYKYINRVPYPRIDGIAPKIIENDDVIVPKDLPNEENISINLSDEAVANWETCRNEEYGYEFKYPKEWYFYNSDESYSKYSPIIIKEGNNCVSGVIVSSDILHIPSKKNKFNLQFSVAKESQDRLLGTIYEGSQSLDEYFSKVTPKFLELHTIINKNYIDEEEALWLKQKNIDNTFFIWIFHNNSLFKISIKGHISNPDLLDAIISTFKFID